MVTDVNNYEKKFKRFLFGKHREKNLKCNLICKFFLIVDIFRAQSEASNSKCSFTPLAMLATAWIGWWTLNNHNLNRMARSLFLWPLLSISMCYVTWPQEDWQEQQDLSWFTDQVCQSSWYITRNKATEHEGHACQSHCNRPGKYSYNKRRIGKKKLLFKHETKDAIVCLFLICSRSEV